MALSSSDGPWRVGNVGATPKNAAMSRGLTPAEQNELVALGRGKELTADAAARIRVLNERVLCQRYANAR